MTHTMTREIALLDQAHRHDTTHRARTIGRSLREPGPRQLPAAFDPAAVADFPEPARRWLTHAIEPGTLLVDAAELQMHGEIKLGRWRPFTATQAIVPDAGFVWAAHTRVAGLPVRGFDSYAMGEGTTRWRMLGLIPLTSAEGYDVTRSAADRLAAESVLLPTVFPAATWRTGPGRDSATYLRHFGNRHSRGRATIHVAADGQLLGVSMRRWGKPIGKHYDEYRFEVSFSREYEVDGVVLPDGITAAWVTPDGTRHEFFRAFIDTADLFLAGGGHDALA
jgi:Family of unknown function (DUF6544)